jgi:hypothetical protein
MERTALLSPSGLYRYRLGRRWSAENAVLWIMLNPSTADAAIDDATIRRCVAYARDWGYGAILVGNVFPYRATNPKELLGNPLGDIEGSDNWGHIREMSLEASLVVCAWGSNVLCRHARERVAKAVHDRPIRCLGLSPSGAPFHPLQRTRKLHLPSVHYLTPF